MSPYKTAWKVKSWRGFVCLKSEIISSESLKTHTWDDILFNKEITHMWEERVQNYNATGLTRESTR